MLMYVFKKQHLKIIRFLLQVDRQLGFQNYVLHFKWYSLVRYCVESLILQKQALWKQAL